MLGCAHLLWPAGTWHTAACRCRNIKWPYAAQDLSCQSPTASNFLTAPSKKRQQCLLFQSVLHVLLAISDTRVPVTSTRWIPAGTMSQQSCTIRCYPRSAPDLFAKCTAVRYHDRLAHSADVPLCTSPFYSNKLDDTMIAGRVESPARELARTARRQVS